MHSRNRLVADLCALGVAPGDVAMLHASMRAIGEVAGGPDEVHRAVSDVLTDDGTLLMYAGCPQYVDEIGRGNLSPEEEVEVRETLPAFDADTARSARDHGILVEFFRTSAGSCVNRHPARFVARGKHVDTLFATQPWDFAFGLGSALDRLLQLDGKIVLLGSDHDAVTFLHYVEHVADLPGKRIARFEIPVLEHGQRVWRRMQEVDTSDGGAHPNWPDRFFASIVDGYLAETRNGGGRVGNARSHVLDVRGLFAFAERAMQRVARGEAAV